MQLEPDTGQSESAQTAPDGAGFPEQEISQARAAQQQGNSGMP
jgi:hypothetical protein